jgi:hypothetical protein
MGICYSSSAEKDRKLQVVASKKFDNDLERLMKDDRKIVKVLLLGTGESGKSTIFRQMQILYKGGFNEAEQKNLKRVILNNVLDSIKAISSRAFGEFGFDFQSEEEKEAAQFIAKCENMDDPSLFPQLSKHIQYLWNESESIKKSFNRRSEYYLIDSADL